MFEGPLKSQPWADVSLKLSFMAIYRRVSCDAASGISDANTLQRRAASQPLKWWYEHLPLPVSVDIVARARPSEQLPADDAAVN